MREYRLKAYKYGKRVGWAVVQKHHNLTEEQVERFARQQVAEKIAKLNLKLEDVVLEGKWVSK